MTIEENQYDSPALWEEAQKMGLELGDLEDYGFSKSAKCGGYCFPTDMTDKEVGTAVDMFVDRFSKSVKDQYEVAMCHPVIAPYRPRVEVVWNFWPFTFIFSLKWRVILNFFTCQCAGIRFATLFCEVLNNTFVAGCGLCLLNILVTCFPCTFCVALIK